jgi:hypothetical protein
MDGQTERKADIRKVERKDKKRQMDNWTGREYKTSSPL